MNERNGRLTVAVALVVGAALLAGFAAVGAASHGSPANFTVYPQDIEDRSPDSTEATYVMSSAGADAFEAEKGLEVVDYYWLESEQADFSDCDPDDARVFGIDRGNNNSGTQVDDGLLEHMKDHSVEQDRITLDLYGEEDFGGDTIHLNAPDATVAVLGDCVENTGEAGWYQFTGFVNGTTYAGDYEEVHLTSHYFWIGDFEDEEEAREELGPPPSNDGGQETPTPTPEPTPTEEPSDDDGETADDEESDETADGEDSDETQQDEEGDGTDEDSTPTEEPSDDDGETADDEESEETQQDEEADETDENEGVVEDRVDLTPTPADGPGFGAVAAVLAVLSVGLLVVRRQ